MSTILGTRGFSALCALFIRCIDKHGTQAVSINVTILFSKLLVTGRGQCDFRIVSGGMGSLREGVRWLEVFTQVC